MFYNLIEEAIRIPEVDNIYYGFTSEKAKLQRGCSSYNVESYIKVLNGASHKVLSGFLDHYNDMRREYFKINYGDYILKQETSFLSREER